MDCDWSEGHIGRDRYTGTPRAAIERYTDIPQQTREQLIARMESHRFDEQVKITNDTPLSRMNYGKGKECATVKRDWRVGFHVNALRYTQDGYTILVPSACGNIVRSTYTPPAPPAAVLPVAPVAYTPDEPVAGTPVSGPVSYGEAPPPATTFFPIYVPVPFYYPVGGGYCCMHPPILPPIAPAVPELPIWMYMMLGAVLIAGFRAKR